ncbi:MAG TPA: hypothetical protein VFC47_08260 [Caulobacteraceae bacterium]|nr:hypothetical protein [Caulobacteraceae bacterium]
MSDDPNEKSATRTLAELVARRKAARAGGPPGGGRESERAAAARSAAKSKPALRKWRREAGLQGPRDDVLSPADPME